MIYTSLNEIKSFNPCTSGWKDILKGQGKKTPDDVLFPLTDALKSNSFSDVCWLLGKRKNEIQIVVNAAEMCANSIAHLKNYAAYAATYAAADAADAADAAAYAAAYAATYAAAADAAYAAADAAYAKQIELNKSFLAQCIIDWKDE